MRKINFLFVLVLFTLVLLSVASLAFAQTTKKTLELSEFQSIYVNSNYTVYVKQSNKQEVTVEALTEIYSLTEIKVENGVLLINVERKPDNPNKSIWAKIDDIKLNPTMKVYVSLRNVNELQVNGGGKIISENSIASDNLSIGVAGNGSIDLDIKGKTVKTELTGAGNITLKGYASYNDILIAGSGSLNAFNLELESAKIRDTGSGTAEVNVTNSLDAMIVGSGSVKHKGNTKTVTKKQFGSGIVDRAY
ncbi:MAG TPA: head GIN domain-containing protein [Cyclobacteriaceae bacterium]|nr:head GIN domain-containing protein [Cyclobacteriaceae bacterium]